MADREIPPTSRGYDPREVVSALQKAIRRSDPDAAVYWSVELAKSGYGAWFFARARTISVEDCSPEATGLVADVKALADEWGAEQKRRKGSGLLFVVATAVKLATAPKSRLVDWMALHHGSDHVVRREIPDEAIDRHTLRGRRLGRGHEHFIEEASRLADFDGDLEDLEARYRELVRSRVVDGEVMASNPWPAAVNMPTSRTYPPSGQLHLEDR